MDTKHTNDTLKTREPLKERDGQPPSLTQPKKQELKFHMTMYLNEDQMYWLCSYLESHPSNTTYYKEFKETIFASYMPYLYRRK